MKFLIIDDCLNCLELYEIYLKELFPSCTVVKAEGGEEALNIIKNNQEFHLIITDIKMPNLSGLDFAKYCRNKLKIKNPIIAITAIHPLVFKKMKDLEVFDLIIEKPVSFNDFREKILSQIKIF